MARLEMDAESNLSPDQIVSALTDFSERRLDIWPMLAPKYYKVLSVGDTTADIQEGSVSGPIKIWARELYDWSTPGEVSFTVQESNFCTPGDYIRVELTERDGGGSRIHTTWERTGTTLIGRFVVAMIKLTRGKPLVTSMMKGLANYERISRS